DFKTYLEHPENHDVMYRHLCRDPEEPAEEAIHFLLNRYTFIGLQEMYPFSIKSVFMLLGQRVEPKIRLRDNQEEAKSSPPPTTEEMQIAYACNKQDLWMFEFF